VNRRQSSGARNHDTLSLQMMPAKNKTKIDSNFKNSEDDNVIPDVLS